jgi:RNA recognition motif-containing protein
MIIKLRARNERRKSRGYGFVTLASEEIQKKAVAEMNGKEIEGREIAVNIAVDKSDEDRLIQGKCYSCGKMGHMAKYCRMIGGH